MANLDAHAAVFEEQRYSYEAYLGQIPEVVRLTGFVNMASVPSTLMAITYDGSTGSFSDVLEGMTMRVYVGSTSVVKGILRVAAGAATSTVIQVNEVANQTVDVRNDDKFEILDEIRIWDVLVSATDEFLKDSRIVYVDQLDEFAPIANGGGPWFGFHDRGETYATVPRSASGSILISGTDDEPEVLWDVGDGTITVGTDTDIDIVVQFPVGFRHIYLTVIDPGNDKSTTIAMPIRVYNRTTDRPLSVTVEDDTSDDERGTNFSINASAADAVQVSSIRHGAFCALFLDEWHGETLGSYGGGVMGSEHMKGCGYFSSETVEIDAEQDTIIFEVMSPLAILEDTPALPQLLISRGGISFLPDTDNWQHVTNLTVWLALWYIIRWGSTTLSYFDLYFPDGISYLYRRLAVEGKTIAEQLRDIAGSIRVTVKSDRLGRILLQRSLNYKTTAQRNAHTITRNLTTASLVRVKITQTHRPRVRTVEGQGITILDQPVFSLAPHVPGPGIIEEAWDKQIVIDQDELDEFTGHRAAEIDGTYYDESTGRIRRVPMGVEIEVFGSDDHYDPGLGEYITIALPASTNRRGLSFTSADRWLLRSRRVTHDAQNGEKKVVLTIDHETKGKAGKPKPKTIEPPPPSIDFDDVTIDPVDIEIAPPAVIGPVLTTVGIGANRLLVSGTAGPYAARGISADGFITLDLDTFEDISSGLLGQSHWWHVFPNDFSRFLQITSEGLFRARPLDSIFIGWEQIATNTELWGASDRVSVDMNLHIGYPGYCVLTSGNMLAISTNVHAVTPTWTKVNATGGAQADRYSTDMNNTSGRPIDIALDPHGSGALYASIYWGGGTGYEQRIYRNPKWGLSGGWSQVLTGWPGATFNQWELLIPFLRPNGAPNKDDANAVSYAVASRNGTPQRTIYRSTNKAVSYSDIATAMPDESWGGTMMRRSIMVRDEDGKTGVVLNKVGGGFNTVSVMYTEDIGAAVPVWVPIFSASNAQLLNLGHNPQNKDFVLLSSPGNSGGSGAAAWDKAGTGGLLQATANRGVDWVDLMTPTNIASILTTTRVAYAQIA